MSLAYTTGNPNNLTGGANASMNDIQGPFVDIKTFLTDGSAAVGDTILTSPTNAVWRTVLQYSGVLNAQGNALTTGTFFFVGTVSILLSGTADAGSSVGGLWIPPSAGDVAVAGKTTRLRLRVPWLANGTVPGINVTWGLYPITGTSGISGNLNVTLGTVIAGSTAVQSSAGFAVGQGCATGSSFDFSAVTGAVAYCFGVTGSGTQAAASMVSCHPILEMRHT